MIPTYLASWRCLFQAITRQHGRRFFRFGVVGISGVLVNSALMYFLVETAHLPHLLAAAAGSEASILSNFALNDRWTFRDAEQSTSWIRRAGQYNTVALSGMLLSLGVLALLMASFGLNYLIANLIAIGAATVSNYALNTRFTWSPVLREGRPTASLAPVAD